MWLLLTYSSSLLKCFPSSVSISQQTVRGHRAAFQIREIHNFNIPKCQKLPCQGKSQKGLFYGYIFSLVFFPPTRQQTRVCLSVCLYAYLLNRQSQRRIESSESLSECSRRSFTPFLEVYTYTSISVSSIRAIWQQSIVACPNLSGT